MEELGCTGINKPACNINWFNPNVFKAIDFPPALGPDITTTLCASSKYISCGIVFKPRLLFSISKRGW